MGRLLYFAYGSNMLTARLARRVAGVRAVGAAWLPGYRLGFHKRGMDGSGKATVVATGATEDRVHGVLFDLPATEQPTLDRIEGGYRPDTVRVHRAADGLPVNGGPEAPPTPAPTGSPTSEQDPRPPTVAEALTYVATPDVLDGRLRPFDWYRDFVVHGAREHGLPEPWLRHLEAVVADTDPDPHRRSLNLQILATHRG